MKNKALYVTIFLILVFLGIMLFSLFKPKSIENTKIIEKKIPEFSLKILNSSEQLSHKTLSSDKFALLNFFASWCTSCIAENADLLDLGKNNKINIYGIAWHDDEKTLTKWLNKNGNPYKKVAIDNEGSLEINLGLTGVPETFLVKNGKEVIFHQKGPLTPEIINQEILPLIKN